MKDIIKKVINKDNKNASTKSIHSKPDQKKPEPLKQRKNTMKETDFPQLLVSSGYSIGKHREKNQDSLYTFTTNIACNGQQSPFGLYIIADGMGGHEKGELASQIAVKTVAEYIAKNFYIPVLNINDVTSESFQTVLNSAIDIARFSVNEQVPAGGTTLTVLMTYNNQMKIAHIGDSRAYLIQDEHNYQILTRDHSLVKRLLELGQITPDEAAVHPQRNILYRAIGQGEQAEAEIISMPLPEMGFLLLCSDGLWGVIPDTQIAHIVTRSTSPHQSCKTLIDAANEAGGPDNISVILIQISP